MRTIEAYQSADGVLHTDERAAKARDDDMLGEALDGLLRLFELDITCMQSHKALLRMLNKRTELKASIAEILQVLDHEKE